ncbi:MAG: type II toxin-antitoxin system Phd/YefM family antitoxin [Rhodothermales bacterium]
MSIGPDIIPISELRRNAAGIISRLQSSAKPVFITQRGRASAVMVSTQTYERSRSEIEILKALIRGEMEIEREEGSDLKTVFAKADDLLSPSE